MAEGRWTMWPFSLSYQKACASLPTALQDIVRAPRGSASIRGIARASVTGAQGLGRARLRQALVHDDPDREVGRPELLAQAAVRGGVGDEQLGVVGGVADRAQAVKLELPDTVVLEGAGQRQDLVDVAGVDGHGRAGRDAEVAGVVQGAQSTLVAAEPADGVVGGAVALQRDPQQVQVGRDLGEAAFDAVAVGADLHVEAQLLLGVPDDLGQVPVDEGLAAEEVHGLGAVLLVHQPHQADGLLKGEGVGVLEALAVEAVPAGEVAAVEQLQVQHPDRRDAGDFRDHGVLLGLVTWSRP